MSTRSKARKKKTASFEETVKRLVGEKTYRNLPREHKTVIKELSECEKAGGPVGSAPLSTEESDE